MSNSKGLTTQEAMLLELSEASEKLDEFLRWDDSVYEEYEKMLNHLEDTNGKPKHECSNDEKKKALEDIVTFLIIKTNLFEVYGDVHTGTSEVDQVVVRNRMSKLAEAKYGITPKVLEIDSDMFLCECKNYKGSVSGTWVGKFNTIMDVCGTCKVGILFSVCGLSGKEETWDDGHGMRKIIYNLSSLSKGQEKYILDFNINDFKIILDSRYNDKPLNFIEIIRKKKIALTVGSKIKFLYESHDNEDNLKELINKYNKEQ